MIDYQIHDVSEKQLKFNSWILEHKKTLIKIPVALLILWSALTVGYGILGFIDYAVDYAKEQKLMDSVAGNLINFEDFRQSHRPQPLIVAAPQVISAGDDSYDFAAQAKNADAQRGVVNLRYQFISGDYYTPTSSIIILPQQTVYLLSLNNKSERRLAGADLNIIETRWESLWQKEEKEEVKIITTPPQFQSAGPSSRSWVSFTASNQSLKNIWQITWQAVLYSGSRLVGVNQIILEEFLAGESRAVELSWFNKLPKITQIDVVPIVDIYDEDMFYNTPAEINPLDY